MFYVEVLWGSGPQIYRQTHFGDGPLIEAFALASPLIVTTCGLSAASAHQAIWKLNLEVARAFNPRGMTVSREWLASLPQNAFSPISQALRFLDPLASRSESTRLHALLMHEHIHAKDVASRSPSAGSDGGKMSLPHDIKQHESLSVRSEAADASLAKKLRKRRLTQEEIGKTRERTLTQEEIAKRLNDLPPKERRAIRVGDHWPVSVDSVRRTFQHASQTRCPAAAASRPPSRRGFGIKSSNCYLVAFKGFCRWLVTERRAPENPLAHLRRINAEGDVRRERRALSAEEFAWLVDAAEGGEPLFGIKGSDRAVLYRIAIGTGFRRKELKSLTPESFDLAADFATVTVAAGYSKRKRTDVQPIRSDLAEFLRPWIASKPAGKPVFQLPHRTAELVRIDLQAARNNWIAEVTTEIEKEARRRSDFLEYCNRSGQVADFHATRHTYISGIVAGGASVKTAQELARHSTPTLTIGRYAHTRLHDMRGALDAPPQ